MATASVKSKASGRRGEILASAAKIFYAKGYHATTIEDVARDVGMLKGSLYYYIKSKEDLLYELLLNVIEQGDANVAERIASATDPVGKLRRALEGEIDHIIRNQVRVGLFLHEFGTLSGRRQRRVQEAMLRYQNRFVEIVQEGQAGGVFLGGDPWLVVNAMLGMCNWIYRWYHGEHKPGLELVQKTFIEILMNGVLKEVGRER